MVPWNHCFSDAQIPSNPPASKLSRARRLHRHNYERMLALFGERPIWLRSALQSHFPEFTLGEFRALLPAVAWHMVDGPWRTCWIRYGYDPKSNSDGAQYQVVELRNQHAHAIVEAFPASLKKLSEASNRHVFDGLQLVPSLSQFQYCDLTFPPLRRLLSDPSSLRGEIDRREGWYVDGTVSQIRKIIKERWMELVRQADPQFYELALKIMNKAAISSKESSVGGDAVEELEEYLADLAKEEEEGNEEEYEYFDE